LRYATTATTQLKLLILAHRSLYTSYTTYAHHKHAEQWSTHHSIRFRFWSIRRTISGHIWFRPD